MTTSTAPYSQAVKSGIERLSKNFDQDGYSDYSEMSAQAYEAFWCDAAQSELVTSIFPTNRSSTNSVRPVYPTGGFDPNYQQLTPLGLSKLIEIAWQNNNNGLPTDRWSQLDGYVTSLPGKSSGVSNIIGAALKHIKMQSVAIDIDLDFFGSNILSEEIATFIINADSAYRVRGNRQRLTLIFKQSTCLQEFFNREYAGASKVIFVSDADNSSKIEISFREGASNNIFGAHKVFSSYQVVFPSHDAIGYLSELDMQSLFRALNDCGFSAKKTEGVGRAGRLLPWEIEDCESIAADVANLGLILKGVNNLRSKFGISGAVAICDMLTPNTEAILNGEIRFPEANRHVAVPKGEVYPICDGFRRNTTWQIFTDLAFICQFFDHFGVSYDPDEEHRIVDAVTKMIEPDITEVVISVYDSKSKTYTSKKVRKWSDDYTHFIYDTEYRNGDKSTVSQEFAQGFLRATSRELGVVMQNFIYQKQKTELEKQGKTIKPPSVEDAVNLSMLAAKDEDFLVDSMDGEIDGMFDIIFKPTGTESTLIDDVAIDEALTQRDLKLQYRLKATNDNWGIFPASFGNHSRRYLRRQKGASYPYSVALMASVISYGGMFQITADPINDDLYEAIAKMDGRKRYTMNTEGNLLLVMQLLTGDSGSGKSYVTKPLETANRIASQAVNLIDPDTISFFRSVIDDKNKLKTVKEYAPQPGTISGSIISPLEYHDVFQYIRGKEPSSYTNYNETYVMTDHSAETAAFRDAMMETEVRMKLRKLANNKLFSGTYYHPMFLFYDEAGAFMEVTYQSSARVTSFCEMKAGNMKEFRRAKSNASGSQNSIQYWAATMHGNLPLPKYLSTAYKADVKDGKAEGVLGRILLGYIERSDVDEEIEFISKYGGSSDEEVLATLSTFAMLIPSSMRRMETESGGSLSYFSSDRDVGNFFFDRDALDELSNAHDRIRNKIETMKDIYPKHSYAYDTYIGKIHEMLYTLAGGHKMLTDLLAMASKIIPKLEVRLQIGRDTITYKGWQISRYIKDRGIQNFHNHTQLLNALSVALLDINEEPKGLVPIRRQNIRLSSLQAAEVILTHHYDVLMYSETLYNKMFGTAEDATDNARRATATALAEKHSSGYIAYRIIENLDRQLLKAANSGKVLRQSDVIRNMLAHAARQKPEETDKAKNMIMMTFSTLVGRLVKDGHLETGPKGNSWKVITGYREVQPLLAELRASFATQL